MSEIPLPPWRRAVAKRPRAAKAPLTQDQIVDAGLRIVMVEGIEAVSMRRIAAVFDTGASSLYAHVANKDELLQLMFDRICAEVEVPEPEPVRWREQIKEMARHSHAVMTRYNNIARAALATVPSGPNALRLSEGMLTIMLAGGVPPQVAAWSLDRLFLYIVADAYENSLHMQNLREGQDTREYFEGFVTQLADFYGDLPADRFPNIRAHAKTLTSGSGDERFEFGLDMLVDGLARYVTDGEGS
ncbi:TetR/AcrR family transcriptional regulator [Actinoplanes sp. NPDC049118]|uniref:TetR/AcrR family transcriptional regulator n=1 Tax=Actinoplanes sp. NPDC049118 TaxID=3155769 RepID=UPI0033F634D0